MPVAVNVGLDVAEFAGVFAAVRVIVGVDAGLAVLVNVAVTV